MHSFSFESAKLAVIGLGYVGLPLAVEFGKHRPVVGFDINTKRIEALHSERVRQVTWLPLPAHPCTLTPEGPGWGPM